MATGIVEGLFGVTPEMYQQQQANRAFSEATEFARLSPFQQAGAGIMYGAGQATRGLLGVEDPQLTMIRNRQQLLQGVDASNPQALVQASIKASSMGDPMLALQLSDRAKTLQSSIAEQMQKTAAAGKTMEETRKMQFERGATAANINQLMTKFNLSEEEAVGIAGNQDLLKQYLQPKSAQAFKLLETGKYDPISVIKWQNGEGELQAIEKNTKPTADFLAKAVELGFGANDSYGKYSPEQVGVINKALFNEEVSKKAAGAQAIRISVNQKQEEEFSKKRGVTQAEELANATTLARGASQALATISNMKQLNSSGELFTGPLANSYITGTNFLASVGLLSPSQTRLLTSSEVYDKQAKDLVMQDLGGKLGAQISDADRKFVEARIPQITTSVKARTELLDKLDQIQRNKIDYYRKMNEHANKFGNLNDFDFSEQFSPIQTPASGLGTRENPIKLK